MKNIIVLLGKIVENYPLQFFVFLYFTVSLVLLLKYYDEIKNTFHSKKFSYSRERKIDETITYTFFLLFLWPISYFFRPYKNHIIAYRILKNQTVDLKEISIYQGHQIGTEKYDSTCFGVFKRKIGKKKKIVIEFSLVPQKNDFVNQYQCLIYNIENQNWFFETRRDG
ncbi:hypothetical protein K8R66_03500 [bacterium]|nr:hypothetical protein [bacterium]